VGATSLDGRRIVITRPTPGLLVERMRGLGALVDHVPLIEIVDSSDGGVALGDALHRLDTFDWLVATSVNGAERVGSAARSSKVKLAAIGDATAATMSSLAGRSVDLVPELQHTDGLLAAFPRGSATVLVAQGNLAGPALAHGLRSMGCAVTAVEAYRTRHRPPDTHELDLLRAADVVVLSSGSAVESWRTAERDPNHTAVVITIGPKTADVAARHGLQVVAVAATPSDDDVLAAVVQSLS